MFRQAEGFQQQPLATVAAGIGLALEDRGLLEGCSQRQAIESRAADGMGDRQKDFRGEAEVTASDLNPVGSGQIGTHQMGFTLLLSLAIDRRTPGGEKGVITEAKATVSVDVSDAPGSWMNGMAAVASVGMAKDSSIAGFPQSPGGDRKAGSHWESGEATSRKRSSCWGCQGLQPWIRCP